jgi:HSP20 family protein
MTRKLMMPWKRDKGETAIARREENPFLDLHRRMDDLFADFFTGFGEDTPWPAGLTVGQRAFATMPKVDVAETDDEVTVTADLPGMTEKDLTVSLDGDLLTIRGTRNEEKEDKKRNYHLVERTHGEFHRVLQMPAGVNRDKIKAAFKNGELKVTLPKLPEAKKAQRHIEITAG